MDSVVSFLSVSSESRISLFPLVTHTSILHDEINFDCSKVKFKYQDKLIFFPSEIQIPLHGKFKTRKLMACLDPKYRIVIHQNIIYVFKKT